MIGLGNKIMQFCMLNRLLRRVTWKYFRLFGLKKIKTNVVFRKSVTNDIYSEYYDNRKKTLLNCNSKIGSRGFLLQGCFSLTIALRMSD